jgi:hypothetical protein
MRVAVVLLVLARTASAEPDSGCESVPYLNPSIFIGPDPIHVLDRIALGTLIRSCDDHGAARMHLRVGFTAYLSTFGVGIGGELEPSYPVSSDLRLGIRLGYETSTRSDMGLLTLGGRLHVSNAVFLEAGGFMTGNPDTIFGAQLGLGLEGDGGAFVGGVELGVFGLGLAFLGLALSGSGR